jgi:hypothetical protein
MSWQRKLNTALNLQSDGQDWGIENSDPNRVMDFLAFYESHKPAHSCECEALADLILQSSQEAIEARHLSDEQQKSVVSFFTKYRAEFPLAAAHWLSLNQTEWAISELLNHASMP